MAITCPQGFDIARLRRAVRDTYEEVARDPHGAGPDEHISWPRVSAHCDFRAPARVDDLLQTEVAIEQLGNKSVTYRFTITRDQVLVAEGRMTAVCCRIRPHLPPEPIVIPDAISMTYPS